MVLFFQMFLTVRYNSVAANFHYTRRLCGLTRQICKYGAFTLLKWLRMTIDRFCTYISTQATKLIRDSSVWMKVARVELISNICYISHIWHFIIIKIHMTIARSHIKAIIAIKSIIYGQRHPTHAVLLSARRSTCLFWPSIPCVSSICDSTSLQNFVVSIHQILRIDYSGKTQIKESDEMRN